MLKIIKQSVVLSMLLFAIYLMLPIILPHLLFNPKEGFLMLSELSGKVHKVHTGVSMVFNQNWETFSVQTDVHFRELTDEMINWYWSLDESRDKAGSYSIQGAGSVLVEKIVGSYTNVVGLPLKETADILAKFGVEIFKDNFSIN